MTPDPVPENHGIFVSDLIPPGKAYVMNLRAIGLGVPGPERGIAIGPDAWAKVPPAERERLFDAVARREAERGLVELQGFLDA